MSASRKRGWPYWRNLLLAGFIWAFLLFYVGYPILIAYLIAHPSRVSPCCITPTDLGLDYEEITFASDDGLTLSGWYIPSQNQAAVIVTHGHAANRVQMIYHAAALARHGYGVLLYDMRAHGNSQGDLVTGGRSEADDLLKALAYVQSRPEVDSGRVGVLGFSMGGEATLVAAARTEKIKAVVLDGTGAGLAWDVEPPPSLGEMAMFPMGWIFYKALQWQTGVSQSPPNVRLITGIAPRPILIIATGQDQREARAGQRLYAAASEPKTLWLIPEAGHGGGLKARPAEYEDRIIAFFNEAL